MTTSPEAIEAQALSLSTEDRARLVVHLLESIEQRSNTDPRQVEHAWLAEADRRYQAWLRGEERAIPVEEVLPELRADDR